MKNTGKIQIIRLTGRKGSLAKERGGLFMYENIDMKKTGLLLKETIEKAGYTVKDIQKILNLSCPQPIYRWFKGLILPSVDHLYVLSRLLKLHMEDLLVPQHENVNHTEMHSECTSIDKRLFEYWKCLCMKKCA